MKLDEAFPSNYLRSVDLQGRAVKVTISDYKMEKLGNETKLILYFRGKEKGMVTNRTNANEIADTFGDDLDSWVGKQIELYVARVDFQGKKVDGLRVRIPAQAAVQQTSSQRPVSHAEAVGFEDSENPEPPKAGKRTSIDDDIPF